MLAVTGKSAWHVAIFYRVSHVRAVSGYKINTENYIRKKHPSNYTDQDIFREKVELSVLQKAKSPLRIFEKIDGQDVKRRKQGPNPNEPYMNRPDLPVYRSNHRYWKVAERERRRQKKEGVWWKTLHFWLKEQKGDPKFVNIGLNVHPVRSDRKLLKQIRKDPALEKAARDRTLKLDLEEVNHEWERHFKGAEHIRTIGHHYNIYRDLFKHGDFLSAIHMDVDYECDEETVNPVYYGNELKPVEASSAPIITHEGPSDRLYTLLMTSPDEHLENNEREYVHWLVGNIPGCEMLKGDTLVDYLPPFPARGTGFQRMVFVLFQQSKKINYSPEQRDFPCRHLCDRDFYTFDFYHKYEDDLTPVSLRFFQCQWDESVRNTYHHVLNMPEPVYEYAKLSEKERLTRLKRYPHRKTLTWLSRFFPKEPVYPDGSQEEKEAKTEAALEASTYKPRPDRRRYPVENVY